MENNKLKLEIGKLINKYKSEVLRCQQVYNHPSSSNEAKFRSVIEEKIYSQNIKELEGLLQINGGN